MNSQKPCASAAFSTHIRQRSILDACICIEQAQMDNHDFEIKNVHHARHLVFDCDLRKEQKERQP